MSKRPVIAITIDSSEREGNYESPCAYSTSVEKAGGLPILLPYLTDLKFIAQYVDLIDGIVFSGGDDLDPALYGEERHPKAIPIDPARQRFELALLAEIERRRVPALGVCCGSQLMNVYRGGSLIQFLPDDQRANALEHRKTGPELTRHPVSIDTQSELGAAIGKKQIQVNTYHKQAVRAIGKGLRVVATAPDGIIEAFEDPNFPLFAAVQWHPERLHDEPEHLAPFELLVSKALKAKSRH
jgi:gamma-glutamyl-gamma-aminobutyrate hydrolase PuuD